MHMKHFILILALILTTTTFAQKDNQTDVESYKIAFITKRLDLDSKQAQEFWPIYNKHNALYEELKTKVWEPIKKDLKNVNNLSDQEAVTLLKEYRSYKKKRLQYREDFIQDLLTVISAKKVMQLRKADYDFNRQLLKQYSSN